MKRAASTAIALAAIAIATSARADGDGCVTESVRVSLVDAGATSMVEISARLAKNIDAGDGCTVAWSRIALATSRPSDPLPNVALVETFVNHERTKPMLLADGLSPAVPRDVALPPPESSVVVALRLVVEDTDGGLRVTVPRDVFPAPTAWARVERRVKSARDFTGKFGEIAPMLLAASPPGVAGGIGPTSGFDVASIVVECSPTGAPITEALPTWTIALDAFRATLPKRALDLSTANDEGWDDLARHAYAAALHSDPLVASLGVSSLAWLAGGLDVQATKLDASNAPSTLVSSIGDVQKRIDQRYGAVGHLLPLGRPTTFREVLRASPSADAPRAKAAKASIARLASVSAADVASMLTPAIIDGTAPVDPPSVEAPIEATPISPTEATGSGTSLLHAPSDLGASVSTLAHRHPPRHRRWSKKTIALALIGLGLAAMLFYLIREPRARREA